MRKLYDVALVSHKIQTVDSIGGNSSYESVAEEVHKEFKGVTEDQLLEKIRACFDFSRSWTETVRIQCYEQKPKVTG